MEYTAQPMSDYDQPKPAFFVVKKYGAVLCCVANIAMMIVYAAMSSYLAREYLYYYEHFVPHQNEDAKIKVIIILILLSGISSAFSLFGIAGILMENLSFTSTFVLMLVINLVLTTINAFIRTYYWAAPIWSLVMTAVVLLYLRDLYWIYRTRKNQFRTHANRTFTKELYFQ